MPVFLKDVKQELGQFGRSVRKYKKFRVSGLERRAAVGIRSIIYRGVVRGETNNYMVHAQFFKVQFQKEEKDGYLPVTVDGELWYYKVPTVRSNPVKLKCSGPDFRFRFEKPLFDNKGLIGTFRRYVRKTPPPPVGKAYANPEDLMGFCKHVWSMLTYLKQQKLVKE